MECERDRRASRLKNTALSLYTCIYVCVCPVSSPFNTSMVLLYGVHHVSTEAQKGQIEHLFLGGPLTFFLSFTATVGSVDACRGRESI